MSASPTPASAQEPVSLLAGLRPQPADALLALIGLHRADPRADKIDVGVGVYRDARGETPIMGAVKSAEALLLAAETTKGYLGPEGDMRFTELLEPIVFGDGFAQADRLTGVQTPGGTGALRLGAELIARGAPNARVWIGSPSWPNHRPIFEDAGVTVERHRYYDSQISNIDFDGMMHALNAAARGDVVLLHACCHNPTGAGFSIDQWRALADLLGNRGLVPFIDLAYQGLGDGLDEDAVGMRHLLASVPEALVAYSCDKNFGLYRERVGALWVLGAATGVLAPVRDNMHALARSLWSMPPAHGAAIVRAILDDTALTHDWRAELDEMRLRINRLRSLLGRAHPRLKNIATQRGMFAMLPIDRVGVTALREQHGIYMADSGRINVAGLQSETIDRFATALVPHLHP